MQNKESGKKCCLCAGVVAFTLIVLSTYVFGYSIGKWNISAWLGAAIVIAAAIFCIPCRPKKAEGA